MAGRFGKRHNRERREAAELEASLQQTRLLISQAYAGFNMAADGELLESYIYEIQSLQARYSYLLRRRKRLEGGGDGDPREAGQEAGRGLAPAV